MQHEDQIPNAFWHDVGGPWYWSAIHGVHDQASHDNCPPPPHDEWGTECHEIKSTKND